jgi:hypothetical protein
MLSEQGKDKSEEEKGVCSLTRKMRWGDFQRPQLIGQGAFGKVFRAYYAGQSTSSDSKP